MPMHALEKHWQRSTWFSTLLLPLSGLYCFAIALRRYLYHRGWLATERLPAPVIVIGNITVGGTGKTPLVLWLAEQLRDAGYNPGVVARGYRGRGSGARLVTPESDSDDVGDEALLLARRAGCPVAVGADRPAAGRLLIERHGCNVVLSDDGLQHYRLARAVEIAVIDGERRLGNGRCLPAGPLREPARRLREVDIRVVHGTPAAGELDMQLVPRGFRELGSGRIELNSPAGKGRTHALAGIGYPQRFFAQLRSHGIEFEAHPFPDHHRFRPADLDFAAAGDTVLMTEKDAVKCEQFARPGWWAAVVDARPDERLAAMIVTLLKERKSG